jgi:hypothetical protein
VWYQGSHELILKKPNACLPVKIAHNSAIYIYGCLCSMSSPYQLELLLCDTVCKFIFLTLFKLIKVNLLYHFQIRECCK